MAAEAEAAREARAKVSEQASEPATWDDPGVASMTELQKKEVGQKRRWVRKALCDSVVQGDRSEW